MTPTWVRNFLLGRKREWYKLPASPQERTEFQGLPAPSSSRLKVQLLGVYESHICSLYFGLSKLTATGNSDPGGVLNLDAQFAILQGLALQRFWSDLSEQSLATYSLFQSKFNRQIMVHRTLSLLFGQKSGSTTFYFFFFFFSFYLFFGL